MAQLMGRDAALVDTIFYASAMHDIGKVHVPDSILPKPGALTAEEWGIMQGHCLAMGHEAAEPRSKRPQELQEALHVLLHHGMGLLELPDKEIEPVPIVFDLEIVSPEVPELQQLDQVSLVGFGDGREDRSRLRVRRFFSMLPTSSAVSFSFMDDSPPAANPLRGFGSHLLELDDVEGGCRHAHHFSDDCEILFRASKPFQCDVDIGKLREVPCFDERTPLVDPRGIVGSGDPLDDGSRVALRLLEQGSSRAPRPLSFPVEKRPDLVQVDRKVAHATTIADR